MSTNPYAAPRSEVRDHKPRRGNGIVAVVLGVVLDIGGSIIGGITIALLYGVVMARSGAEEPAVAEAITHGPPRWTPFWYLGYVEGFFFSLAGGYLCARFANHSELRLGAIAALASSTIGFLLAFGDLSVELLVSVPVSIAVTLAGARLGQLRNHRAVSRAP